MVARPKTRRADKFVSFSSSDKICVTVDRKTPLVVQLERIIIDKHAAITETMAVKLASRQFSIDTSGPAEVMLTQAFLFSSSLDNHEALVMAIKKLPGFVRVCDPYEFAAVVRRHKNHLDVHNECYVLEHDLDGDLVFCLNWSSDMGGLNFVWVVCEE